MRNFKDIKHKRFIFYFLAFLIGFAAFLPLPFAPEILKDFINIFGQLLFIPIFLLLIVWSSVFLTSKMYNKIFEVKHLFEAIAVPLFFIVSLYFFASIFYNFRTNLIISLNDKSKIEDFVNPFLGTKIYDCRQVTEDFEVMFVPEHFGVETDLLLYSSKGTLSNKYGDKRTVGSRWFIVFIGSMWGDDFRNCAMQNKRPND